MDFWNKARGFVDEAAKRSQELTREAAKRSSELKIGSSTLSDVVSETAKRSMEFAAEASKRADQIRAEASKRADQIKSLAEGLSPSISQSPVQSAFGQDEKDLERLGITEELREFVKGITINTFTDFPMQDDSPISDVPQVSNVRQDLSKWQEKHANLVLLTVKEISKLRYELCPRVMRERKFWRIYFIIVNNHVAPYEKQYMEELELNSAVEVKDDSPKELSTVEMTYQPEVKEPKQQRKPPTAVSSEQDLDVFLLGEESDDGADDFDDGEFEDDLDKLDDGSDDEKEKK